MFKKKKLNTVKPDIFVKVKTILLLILLHNFCMNSRENKNK